MMPQTGTEQPDSTKIVSQIKELVTKNDSGIIVLPAKATPDAIAAATALYMAITKLGKNVSLVASAVPESDLIGVDKIKTDLTTGGENLVVSFPYKEGAIDKVDYNIQNERFNLVIIPREGHTKLVPTDVQYSYTGGKIDFIITIDTPNLNALGDIYLKNQREFEGKNIINIDRHLINNSYGTINLVVKTSSSTSELILQVLTGLKVTLDRDMATNLYAGIVAATNNFTAYSVNADTFEAVAQLLRAGAVKKPMMMQPGRAPGMPPAGMNNFSFGQGFEPGFGMSPTPSFPTQAPAPQQHRGPSSEQQQKAVQQVEKVTNSQEGNNNNKETPENFLKPKIFSESGGLV